MAREFDRKIVLEDGTEYLGYSFGAVQDKVCEFIFNTAMVGYQEIVSDPTYAYQAVLMTYPLIGNYGVTDEDYETRMPNIGALICREYNENNPSNFRATKTLAEWMEEYHIPGVFGMDTRKLARNIRDHGTQKGLITSPETTKEEALRILKETELPTDAVSKTSCKKTWYSKTQNARYHVVAVDCGIKLSVIRELNLRGCNITVVPYNTSAEEIIKMKPDGIYLSDGPGAPQNVPEVMELIHALKGKYPMFGIGLGHQLIGLAYGAQTYKMKVGHHGANHPIKHLADGRIEIATESHNYALSTESIADTDLQITHIDLLDQTIEGISCEQDKVFSLQYYSEYTSDIKGNASPFDRFISNMKEGKQHA